MGTTKRQRQKEARQARIEAEQAAQRRSSRLRRLLTLAAVAVGVFLLLVLITRGDGDGQSDSATDVATDDTTEDAAEDDPDSVTRDVRDFEYGTGECAPENVDEPRLQFDDAPQLCIDPTLDYTAVIETTKGSFTVALHAAQAPGTVNNFVNLARWRYYEGATFHRIIPEFVVQGGDPVGEPPGTGGPGYRFADELPEPGSYAVGSVAMANSGPDTNGSQFFVVTGPQGEALPPNFSRFGSVTEGLDVVLDIEAVGTPSGEPTEVVEILSVTIIEG